MLWSPMSRELWAARSPLPWAGPRARRGARHTLSRARAPPAPAEMAVRRAVAGCLRAKRGEKKAAAACPLQWAAPAWPLQRAAAAWPLRRAPAAAAEQLLRAPHGERGEKKDAAAWPLQWAAPAWPLQRAPAAAAEQLLRAPAARCARGLSSGAARHCCPQTNKYPQVLPPRRGLARGHTPSCCRRCAAAASHRQYARSALAHLFLRARWPSRTWP